MGVEVFPDPGINALSEFSDLGEWQDWTPTVPTLTLGNGTQIARYMQVGSQVSFNYYLKFGSTTSITGSNFTITPPVPADTTTAYAFSTYFLDSGTLWYTGHAAMEQSSSTIMPLVYTGPGIGTTSPFTWTTNDVLTISGTYEAATSTSPKVVVGQPATNVFTNEAARDAAIPAPFEGQSAYLTAPTVPAATGDTTAVPVGVSTTYDGSAWACVTPVWSYTQLTGTTTSTSLTATLGGSPGTNPSVTLETGTTARISFNLLMMNTTTGPSTNCAVAVSGATTRAAQGIRGAQWQNTGSYWLTSSVDTVFTGLTAGINTFTLNYYAASGTGYFAYRNITVQGIAGVAPNTKVVVAEPETYSNPVGAVVSFAGSVAPTGWLMCDGSAVSRTYYSSLFTLLGTTYGSGDGSTTFNLPDLQGRVPVGYDSTQTEFDALGETNSADAKTHTLITSEMPAHTHALGPGSTAAANYAGSGGLQGTQATLNTTIASAGGGGAHNNLQPYIVLNYIIRVGVQ